MDSEGEVLGVELEVTSWTGGVKNHVIGLDDSDSEFEDTEKESESSEDDSSHRRVPESLAREFD